MRIIAIDTCLGALSVAVRWSEPAGAVRIVSAHETLATGHAERLAPMIDEVMREAPFQLREIERIAVTVGPGTFTGVRTGVATARALALATGAKVAGLTSMAAIRLVALERMASGPQSRPLAIAVDARRGEIYFQAPGGNGQGAHGGIELLSPAVAAALLPDACLLAGSGAILLLKALRAVGRDAEIVDGAVDPDARSIAAVADTLPELSPVEPLYIRAPDATPQAGASLPRLRAST